MSIPKLFQMEINLKRPCRASRSLPTAPLATAQVAPVDWDSTESDKQESATGILSELEKAKTAIFAGFTFHDAKNRKFCIVSTQPEFGGVLAAHTAYVFNVGPCRILDHVKVHIFENGTMPDDVDILERRLSQWDGAVEDFFIARVGGNQTCPVFVGQGFALEPDLRFAVLSAVPELPRGTVGLITSYTTISSNGTWDQDLIRISLRLEDSLPNNIFEGFLKPYFLSFPQHRYQPGMQFDINGYRFQVSSADPNTGGYIGPSTIISVPGSLERYRLT